MEKQIYEKPQVRVFDLEAEGVICASGDQLQLYEGEEW